jgi:hypothetical protein
MNDFERPHTTQGVCLCAQWYLVTYGVVSCDWDAWPWIWLSGEARGIMCLLTGQEPVRFTYPKQTWAGAVDWFDRAGVGLVFDDERKSGCP